MPGIVSFLLAIISFTVIDNVILNRYFGICSFVGVSNKVKSAVGMGLAVTFVTIMAALVCWPIYNFILVPAEMPYMETIVFILVLASKKKKNSCMNRTATTFPNRNSNCLRHRVPKRCRAK